jgi:sec-independent protein translocase protein TatA
VLADIFGPDVLIVIAVAVVLLLFGGSRLPKLFRSLGSASHEFKRGLEEGDDGELQTPAHSLDSAKDA